MLMEEVQTIDTPVAIECPLGGFWPVALAVALSVC